jgi:hypothetical protein
MNMHIHNKWTGVHRKIEKKLQDVIMALIGILYLIGTKEGNHRNVLELRNIDGMGTNSEKMYKL